MLIKLGPLAAEVAGSTGGLTMQRSPFGTVARSKPLPIRRQNRYTGDSRQRLAMLAQLWRTLSPTVRADWDTFAGTVSWFNRFGDPVTGSGYRAFLRCNLASHTSPAQLAQQPVQLTYPLSTVSTLPASPEFVYDLATDKLSVTSLDGATTGATWLFMFASQPFPAGRSVCHTPMPFLVWMQHSKSFPRDITADYVALHGRLPNKTEREAAFLRLQAHNSKYMWPGLDTVLPLVYK